jgi:hypothetical protein
MKKTLLTMLLLFIALTGLKAQIILPPPGGGSCNTGITGNIIDHTTSYNCNQYVRAAIIQGSVNMTSGVPNSPGTLSSLNQYAIASSDDFIRVCNKNDADAMAADGFDHSLVMLNGGFYNSSGTLGDFASTPGFGSKLYEHSTPGHGTSVCDDDYNFYAKTTDMYISGSSTFNIYGNNTYNLVNKPSYVNSVNWVFDTNIFEVVSQSSTQLVLKEKCDSDYSNVSNSLIYAELSTSCLTADGGYKPKIKKYVTTNYSSSSCTGTLNCGSLYTFNSVSAGATNYINMNADSWTWVKTQGSASYTVSDGGKNLQFSVPSGSATFNAYNSSCNLTFTFSAGYGYAPNMEFTLEDQVIRSYSVVSLSSYKVVRDGTFTGKEGKKEVTRGLPRGFYAVTIDGKTKKVFVTN